MGPSLWRLLRSRIPLVKAETWILGGALLIPGSCGDSGRSVENHEKEVVIDGSSTVYPIAEAIAEEFARAHPDIRISVQFSGTGGGFKKFLRGETDINNASREIRPEERELAEQRGITYIELPVGKDGITVVVHPQNTWMNFTWLEELERIWAPEAEGVRTKWSDIRDTFPDAPLRLYGPGAASGTFDFFTEHVLGKKGRSRGDYNPSEDDNQLVQGVAGDPYALGYFGFAYYVENQQILKAIPVARSPTDTPIMPTIQTIRSGKYPLSRPLYMYIRADALKEKPAVYQYVMFFLDNASRLVREAGYVPFPDSVYQRWKDSIQKIYESGAVTSPPPSS